MPHEINHFWQTLYSVRIYILVCVKKSRDYYTRSIFSLVSLRLLRLFLFTATVTLRWLIVSSKSAKLFDHIHVFINLTKFYKKCYASVREISFFPFFYFTFFFFVQNWVWISNRFVGSKYVVAVLTLGHFFLETNFWRACQGFFLYFFFSVHSFVFFVSLIIQYTKR